VLGTIRKAFEPYKNLWSTAQDWLTSKDQWVNGKFLVLDAEKVEVSLTHTRLKHDNDNFECIETNTDS
jgi:hypothetical protein